VKALREEAPQSQTRRQAFNGDQIEALLATSRSGKWKDSGWEGAILCGMTTGLRLGDVVGLKWEQVNMKTRVVKVATAKTDNDLSIPLHSSFVSWLKNQTRGIGKAPVFPSLHGRSIGGANGLSRAFKKLMDSAGVKGDVTRRGADQDTRAELKTRAGRTLSSLSFHSLRHTATSLMANAGVAADTRKAITGHADDRVHDKYTHHELETLRKAVNKIQVPQSPSQRG
jgi:integrase